MLVKRPTDSLLVLAVLIAATAGDLVAQRAASTVASAGQTPATRDDPVLPVDMLPVPGGTFDVGIDANELIAIEEKLNKFSPEQRIADSKRLMAELGKRRVTLDPYYMGRFPVTNAQYRVFVERTGHRFPFHWWRYGREDSYTEKLPEIMAAHKDAQIPALEYWKRNWKELPWQIPVDNVSKTEQIPMDDYPVVYVSWSDAIAYAAWAGMRLPTEFEWQFASGGNDGRMFVWGNELEGLAVQRGPRNDRVWAVGKFGEATTGPFGHQDLVLGVWEWTGNLGFFSFPENKKDFDKALEQLFKDKLFKDKEDDRVVSTMEFRPEWAGDKVVLKGGTATGMRSELRIGTRGYLESMQTTALTGFRLAKSQIPARDMSGSMIKLDYDTSFFGNGRKPNLGDQVGAERYELSPDGKQILGYHALSIVPVNIAVEDKGVALAKILEATVEEHRPFVVGTFISTEKLKSPDVGPGIYTLCYRHSGMPNDLRKALPEARKAIKAAKGGDVEAGEWSKVLSKFNITYEEAASGDVDFVRLNPGGLQVSTKDDFWILRDQKGDYVQSFPATKAIETAPKYADGDATMAVEPRPDGTERVTFDFGVPTDDKAKGRVYKIQVLVELPPEAAGGAKWRFPAKAK